MPVFLAFTYPLGLFSKLRMLLLTDKPRLLYADPDTKEVKGEVPWTAAQPVTITVIDTKHFDMVTSNVLVLVQGVAQNSGL